MSDLRGASNASISAELVRRVQIGDERAWEDLYLRYRDRLLFSIRCRLGAELRRRVDSEDILQSVIREALTDIDRFVPETPHAFEHYLYVCVLNKIRAKWAHFAAERRDMRKSVELEKAAEVVAAADGGPKYANPMFERLEVALRQLPEEMREVVLLRKTEGLSNDDVAAIIGKSPEATSKIFNRAVAKLGVMLRTKEGP
jgi:RNA polymerase sigma factor (sigma-70 family)